MSLFRISVPPGPNGPGSPTKHGRFSLFTFYFLLFTSPVLAQTELKIPEVPDTKIDFLVPVTAPAAYCAMVDDGLGIFAVGHKAGAKPQVSLFRLDAHGKPAAAPVGITLPAPATLAKLANYPLSLAFHPRLPLLYVWQDAENLPGVTASDPKGYEEFDHLLVYQVDREPKLLQAVGRGPVFSHAQTAGSIALNASGNRVYVPNLYSQDPKPSTIPAVGYFYLDAQGLVAAKTPEAPGKLGGITNEAAPFPGLPAGLGMIPIGEDVVIACSGYGPMTWNEKDRSQRYFHLFPHPTAGLYYIDRMVCHPELPVIYLSVLQTNWACRIEHADGYPTLQPQLAFLDGMSMHSPPVVLNRRRQVAFGGVSKVYLVGIDDRGRYKTQRVQAAVTNPEVQALAYSEKLDRLYVAVEKGK